MDQQSEASTLGMWLFLATEVMFFGGLLTAYRGLPDDRSAGGRAGEPSSSTSCSAASIPSSSWAAA